MSTNVAPHLQPDQQPARWDDHVGVYEDVFEPITNLFAQSALDGLGDLKGSTLLDVAAGAGGASIEAARRGAVVTAIDGSGGMVRRIEQRATAAGPGTVHAKVMDGMALDLPDRSFDAAISIFGVVLFPDAGGGMREIARVLRPGGQVAVVTWTQPQRYELAARLRQAILAVRGEELPPSGLPAQLRFTDPAALGALLTDAGLAVDRIELLERSWTVPGARWLGERIAFAPGMNGMMQALGSQRDAVVDKFVSTLEDEKGAGPISLSAVAHVAFGRRP